VNRQVQDPRILEYLLREKAATKGFLAEPENVGSLVRHIESLGYKPEVSLDLEHGAQKVTYREGSQSPRTIGHQLLSGGEFQRLTALHKAIGDSDQAPFSVHNGQPGETKIASRQALITHLMELGKKDLTINRYKGLGEMNPEQLWETTMDPEKRTLLQVQINDKVFTDDIFTILMGDAVEPRRQFIEANALDVKNLDI
jgi:DNA gyrase subunit B